MLAIPSFIMGQTSVSFQQSNISQGTLAQITLPVSVDLVAALNAASITFTFDTAMVNYNTASQGSFMTGAWFFVSPPTAFNPNRVIVDQVIPSSGNVSGSGILCTLKFTPKKAGTSLIIISASQLLNGRGQTIPHTVGSCTVKVHIIAPLKMLLQGCYQTTDALMRNSLNTASLLPQNHPFSGAPWNHTGTESVGDGFFTANPSIVDWVLVELRTGLTKSSMVARRAGFLLRNGTITDTDGSTPLSFPQLNGNYYLVITQRNHLPVITAASQALSTTSSVYDFSSSQGSAFGIQPLIQASDGKWMLIAGDGNGDGAITANDRNISWIQQNGQFGYMSADFNLDGFITASDLNIYWIMNNGKSTQVPQ